MGLGREWCSHWHWSGLMAVWNLPLLFRVGS